MTWRFLLVISAVFEIRENYTKGAESVVKNDAPKMLLAGGEHFN